MRQSNALLARLGLSAMLLAWLAHSANAQETPAPGNAAPPAQAPATPPAAAPAQVTPQIPTPSPAPTATPQVMPQYADMLYAADAGMLGTEIGEACGNDACGTCGDAGCDSCCAPLFWGSVEALAWWQKGQDVPALVTTSPPGTAQGLAGVLGADTTVLVGEEFLPYDGVIGGRFTVGHWLDDSQQHAVVARYWLLANSTYDNLQTSDGTNILAIPFFNVDTAAEDARLVGFPNGQQGTLSGSVNVHAISKFNGGDVLLRTPIYRDCMRRLDLVAGYQFSRQDETLGILSVTNIQTTPGGPIDTTVTMLDQFSASNEFHGGVLGLSLQRNFSNYSLDILAKCGFGDMRQTTFINGSTTTVTGAGTTVDDFGLFAQSTNIGRLVDNRFCVVPEINVNLGYYILPCLKVYGGYSFIYWSAVARPGAQIDPFINTTFQGPLPVGDRRPDHSSVISSNNWLQGVNVGVEYRF